MKKKFIKFGDAYVSSQNIKNISSITKTSEGMWSFTITYNDNSQTINNSTMLNNVETLRDKLIKEQNKLDVIDIKPVFWVLYCVFIALLIAHTIVKW